MLIDQLALLGFSEKEAKIYMALLEFGSAKATQLAKKTDINRATVYDFLEILLKKGLISKYKRQSATFFSVSDPYQLLTYFDREKMERGKQLDEQKLQAQRLIPQLLSLQNIFTASKPHVRFFEGEKGMREAYEDTLTSQGTILAYANVQTMHEGLPHFFPEYYKRRAAKRIFIRAILPRNSLSIERSKQDQEEMRETRFLPSVEATFSPEVNIYNNKMLVASWREKTATILESKELVDLQRLTFQLLWNVLPRK